MGLEYVLITEPSAISEENKPMNREKEKNKIIAFSTILY